jgi:glutamine synthetase
LNYSTKETRGKNGFKVITDEHLPKLAAKHKEHIFIYGEGNKDRLTGGYETSSYEKFGFGVGNRGASIRIPVMTE